MQHHTFFIVLQNPAVISPVVIISYLFIMLKQLMYSLKALEHNTLHEE